MTKLLKFYNCRLLRNHCLVDEDLWIRDGVIVDPETIFFTERILADDQIDCYNAIIAPGYIDLQINGGYGIDFTSNIHNVEEGINKVSGSIIQNGVTSFCPTLVTSSKETYRTIIPNLPTKSVGANILGWHLEGPFINPEKRGAHQEKHIQVVENGINTIIDTYGSLNNVKVITLAPEMGIDDAVLSWLTEKNITVAIGHSMGSLTDGKRAFEHGATFLTHLFNAMLPFHHRDPGLVGLLASSGDSKYNAIYYGIIADGVHTDPAALQMVYRIHPEGLVLVTDAISALGLGEGTHFIGQAKYFIQENKAYVAGTETLCGSIATMDECVRLLKKATGCSTAYAIECASLHPAKSLKIENKKGTLDFNSDADFIFLNDNLDVLSTWINGKCVFDNSHSS